MRITISGMGRMGSQVVKKLHEGGHEVTVHNRSAAPVEEMKALGMKGSIKKEEAVAEILWIMIPSDALDGELEEWLAILPKDSIIIDGGNSDFRLTKKRAARVKEAGSTLLDVGTSGGIWGYQNGFSMMAGGDEAAFKKIEPLLETLSKPRGAYGHFGEYGAGHYVKMVHNAIEYGMMESYAEGYRLLKEGPYKDIDLAAAGEVWQHGSVINSWLNGLMRDALKENPKLAGIEGTVAESGEARWALEVAKELGIEAPSIQASFDVRLRSQKGEVNFTTKLLALTRNAFGGHKINDGKK